MSDGELAVVDETSTTLTSYEHEQFDLVDVEGAKEFMNNYQETIKALLTPEDYQTIANKDFKKKSAWRKLATAFRISDEVVQEELKYDDEGQIVSAKYRVKAILPNGRSTEGVGICTIFDKIRYKPTAKFEADTKTPSNFELRGRFSNAEHDVPSTAHTRAKNRAISDLIGAGDVSAEEMSEIREEAPKKQRASRTRKSTSSNDKPKQRGRRKKAAENTVKEESETVEAEVIETKAEVVEDKQDDNSLESIAAKNSAVKKAMDRIIEAEETVSKASVVDELLDLFDIGTIDLDEYNQAKKDLGF